MAGPLQLTRTHRILIALVVTGAVIIAGIGFAGSYAAVRELAIQKGFGNFSYVFPIGIDAGICVLLALDLLLTWIRIPFPLLRQTAWLLTAATIAFNGAAAWPDPLGVGMHGVIPILFVVSVEAARHAIGRIADITADKHMEGVRITRWLLSPIPTFLLWRRMKLWELRSYEQVIKLEQERLVYQARMRSRFGRAWRRKAPVESLMPLRLAKYGVPLAETAPAGLAAAGIEPALLPPAPAPTPAPIPAAAELEPAPPAPTQQQPTLQKTEPQTQQQTQQQPQQQPEEPEELNPWFAPPQPAAYEGGYDPDFVPEDQYAQYYSEQQRYEEYAEPQYAEQQRYAEQQQQYMDPQYAEPEYVQPEPPEPGFRVPSGPGRTRPLGNAAIPSPRAEQQPTPEQPDVDVPREEREEQRFADDASQEDAYYQVFRQSTKSQGSMPSPASFGADIESSFGHTLTDSVLKRYLKNFENRLNAELAEDHIA
ncbi:DUF2637 domain-containing protein [Streptomyces sp. NPDC091292]|uniref:DUF2637 domain-containing protein n=1 Tax=Streptomyces sp. NPDC091292 TaxID=3365991 RepID=UPI0038281FE5